MFFICYTGYVMDFGSETGNTTAQRLELSSRRTTITPLNEATHHDPHRTQSYNPPRYQPHYGVLIVIIGVLLLLIAGIAGLTNILSRLR